MLRFNTTVLKPWNDLCALLTKQVAFQADMGQSIVDAGNLAVAIRHLPESYHQFKGDFLAESIDFKLMDDLGDGWKHGSNRLRDKTRRHDIHVKAIFEISEDNKQLRFVRNSLTVTHASHETFDFLEVSSKAIRYWMNKAGLTMNWDGEIKVSDSLFHEKAILYYDPELQLELKNTRIQIVKNMNGVLVPFEAPSIDFEVRAID